MLDQNIKNQLKEYFQKIEKPVSFQIAAGDHAKKAELLGMLREVADLNDKLSVKENVEGLPGPVSFRVDNDGETGVVFSGIPGGHEFSSLILAILQAGGHPSKLDDGVKNLVKNVNEPLHFQTVVSLDCHNCPEVIQTLNSFALLNTNIASEMIDGALHPEFVEKHKVQGVPAVFLNGEPFSNGKVDAGTIVEKLLARAPADAPVASEPTGEPYDVLIVGGGPGGIASAVYSARKGLRVGLVADRIGGQVRDTMDIENLVAIFKTTGPELSQTLGEQLGNHGVDLREHVRVREIQDGSPLKTVILNTGEVMLAKTIIVSTGAKWRELNVPGEKENIGNGVAYCPHCDGPFFKGKDVAVIGGGNSGVEAALDLAGIVKSVKVVEFGPRLNADQILLDRLERTANISYVTNAATRSIETADGKVNRMVYVDRTNDSEHNIDVSGVFVQIGLIPNSDFIKELVETNKFGEIIVDDKCQTNVPGIFACGDVTTTPYKQIVIALGAGAKASLSAFEYLLKLPEEASEKAPRETVAVA